MRRKDTEKLAAYQEHIEMHFRLVYEKIEALQNEIDILKEFEKQRNKTDGQRESRKN